MKTEQKPKEKKGCWQAPPLIVASTDTAAAGADSGGDDTHPTPVATSSGDTR
jgi:hypothetical protein